MKYAMLTGHEGKVYIYCSRTPLTHIKTANSAHVIHLAISVTVYKTLR